LLYNNLYLIVAGGIPSVYEILTILVCSTCNVCTINKENECVKNWIRSSCGYSTFRLCCAV